MINQNKKWSFLNELLQEEILSPCAYFFAKKLFPQINEDTAATICHIFNAACKGHLCVQINKQTIYPNVSLWWILANQNENLAKCEQLSKMIKKGAKNITENKLDVICIKSDLFYLEKNWQQEQTFIKNFNRIKNTIPTEQIENIKLDDSLKKEQKQAIMHATKNCLTIISGGPGTGKTYIVKHLIKTFKNMDLVLTAPTGKATSHLSKCISQNKTTRATSKTLHALLQKKQNYIDAHLIIVDESSMIDIEIMSKLLSSIKNGTRLLMLGDKDQLPPVNVGNPFEYIVKNTEFIELKKCMRTDSKNIHALSQFVNEGNSEQTINLLSNKKEVKLHTINFSEPTKHLQEKIAEFIVPLYKRSLSEIKLLSPLKKGPFGSNQLNKLIYNKLQENELHPIIITKNDYQLDLYNGETGAINENKNYALFPGDNKSAFFDEKLQMRKIPLILLPKHEYAYCISVHKSQGSEYNKVILILPEESPFFGKKMLYTAITRAKKKCEIWSNCDIIQNIILQPQDGLKITRKKQ